MGLRFVFSKELHTYSTACEGYWMKCQLWRIQYSSWNIIYALDVFISCPSFLPFTFKILPMEPLGWAPCGSSLIPFPSTFLLSPHRPTFFPFGYAARHTGSWFPHQDLNPCPLQWKHSVLTTGSPDKSSFLTEWFNLPFYCPVPQLHLSPLPLCWPFSQASTQHWSHHPERVLVLFCSSLELLVFSFSSLPEILELVVSASCLHFSPLSLHP